MDSVTHTEAALRKLAADLARVLCEIVGQDDGYIRLDLLTTLTPEVAEVLAEYDETLWLCGLTELSTESAVALAKHEGQLMLDGLISLTPHIAAILATHKGEFLSLYGIEVLSDEVAGALAQYEGTFEFHALSTFSDKAAEILGFDMEEYGLTPGERPTLSEEEAAEMRTLALDEYLVSGNPMRAAQDVATSVEGQDSNSKPSIEEINQLTIDLARHIYGTARGEDLTELDLSELTCVTEDVLAHLPYIDLHLNGLTTVPLELAEFWEAHQRVVHLNGVTTLSDEAAALLRVNPYIRLPDRFKA